MSTASGSDPPIVPVTLGADDREFIRSILRDTAGIEIGDDRDSLLASRLGPIVLERDLGSVAGLVMELRTGNRQLENNVIEAMTTNETSFFRDPGVFEDIATGVIPRLLEQIPRSAPLTIWSAASSSGQEAYSLAMLLDERFPELLQARRVRILATDLSPEMVQRTRAACYSRLEVRRGLSDARLNRYFSTVGGNYVVNESLRSLVLSRQLNLVQSLGPLPRCDLVLIRNVLIYFPSEVKSQVLKSIWRFVLSAHGALILGASEMLGDAHVDYQTHSLPTISYFTPRPIGAEAPSS
ncbi:MAG: protein-glutamate O-methyltransferase CheR [Actinomycetia bacterium]|nr:protein-glutamate O-methyltransferase CheR [Actinomycetes bacterium]MCP4221998.1 protein-glutamate O-methyltransferase CheR [Actinomycetes bacterium]MCP5035322.1 protein-glutamate O-methyltransferase CheR [Actinomycetes bacterium]